MDDPANQDFSMDNGLVCRWMTGQAKISPKISAYYSKPSNQEKLAHTIHQNLLPLMSDCNMAIQDIYTLFIQDDSISDAKKKNLTPLYKPASSRLLFLAKLISFGMERQFIKRNTKNQKLLAGGALSPIVLDYIMDSEVPKPCRHFIGRDKELEELYTMLEENRHVFLYGIAGIGKSELAKAYAKRYMRHYTNILYVEYTGNLHQDITDMDFIDDLPESTEQERFQRHNRFLRSLKSDTLLIIDNFNVTATQDSFLSVVLKYRCQILFTTRSKLDEYCTLPLKEISDMNALFQLASVFYSEADTYRATVEKIIETVHSHTFAVELAAKLLENGISTPDQLLTRLQVEKASFHNEDKIKIIKDGQSSKATYYSHIHTLFSLYTLSLKQQDIMCNLCFLPSTGISARIFAKWLELPTLSEINDLIETGFVQTTTHRTISLHPMIQEITLSETKPSVSSCHTLLDSLQHICLMHGMEVDYYKKLFQTIGNILDLIEKDDMPKYLLFLENAFPYMDNYNYHKGMKEIIQELKVLLKTKSIGTDSDRALLLDFQAALETKPEKAIKLEKDALAKIENITADNARLKGQLFTDIDELGNFPDYPKLIEKYNDSLYSGHRPESDLMLEHNQVFINEYKLDTCTVIEKLQELSESGIENYSDDVEFWLLFGDYEIDCDEKKTIITRIFSESKVGVIYGSAGVGKSTLINHVSHYLNEESKLYLTQTNPAKENLMRKIDAENTTFSTIESFKRQGSAFAKYKLLVIDECSTVSNKDMVEVLQKANFEMLLLVGDTYQIDAIQFGNWFSVLKAFLPESAVFELTQPHRTKDERLLELWDKVRQMDDTAKEVIERESYSLKVDESLLSSLDPGEAILCLNYDGLYGINNINRFLQESNPNPAVQWDIQQYKVGDPILFLDSDRFFPVIHNNLKGIIKRIEILDPDTHEERIQFDVEIPKTVDESDLRRINLELLECWESEGKSLVRFCVHKLKSADEDGDESTSFTVVPFQIAYAVSIHKAQGLEYDSVKIVITDEVEELVTHNIFYTAITRARKRLKIYWTPEVEEKVINRIRPRNISKDVELLKNYLTEKQQEDELDFWL